MAPRSLALLCLASTTLVADGLIPPLDSSQTAWAAKTIASFKTNPRGPFLRIRWFCADGSVLPPDGTPCKARGGGVQHAELSQHSKQLAGLHIHTGALLTGLPFDDLFDDARDHHRLKELVLEKFLVETDQGWIYRRAVSYRGARQIEDEEKAGRAFLIRLLSYPQWAARNYFLANQLLDAIPHGIADSSVKRIRNLAASAADLDPRFQPIRAKIHSYPGPEDVAAIESFLTEEHPSETARGPLVELATLLKNRQNPGQWIPRLRAAAKRLGPGPVADAIEGLIVSLGEGGIDRTRARAADLSMTIRAEVTSSRNGTRNLDLLDLNVQAQERIFEMRQALPDGSRLQWLEALSAHFRMAAGAGLLSMRQIDALLGELRSLAGRESLDASLYRASIRYLGRASEWMRATAAKDFGPLVRHYLEVEPAAQPLVDHLLRGSPALALASLTEALLADADQAAGLRHSILGRPAAGVAGLNPGVAIGKLGFLEPGQTEGPFDPRGIYVIPETASDLKPMAGILTLDSGNLLSHAQLLAANLGIPNAVIPSRFKAELHRYKGREMFLAVTPRNVVILKDRAALSETERRLWGAQPAASRKIPLDTRRLRLDDTRLRSLREVNTADSGVICGPKAANLGQLAAFFPEQVAPGIVVPFGVFHRHIARDLDSSGATLEQQITNALASAEKMLEQGTDPAFVVAHTYPQLARFRKIIQSMPLLPDFEKELRAALEREIGPDGSYGAFVRSDTNAEDLPEFTGAGLNLTVPNQVGAAKIAQALKNVWASPYTERAYDWRSRALTGTHRVVPSVIIMRTVPSGKSGVIATVDLESGDPSFTTVNTSEGTSAVVDGGVAESLLLASDGAVRLLQQCRATYRKVAQPAGGFINLPPFGGDFVLEPDEIAQLRRMVSEVKKKYPPLKTPSGSVLPWDIEFGFEKGRLRLFQIRPLARFQEFQTLEALASLESPARASVVRLSEKPLR